jgi:hypothetical protein
LLPSLRIGLGVRVGMKADFLMQGESSLMMT